MDKETVKRELAARETARRDFGGYLAYVQGPMWKETRLARFLARRVQDFVEEESGNAYDILLIQTPPQHGKSQTVTESLPSWYLGRWPEKRVILGSYNDVTAERFARRNKEKLKSVLELVIVGNHFGYQVAVVVDYRKILNLFVNLLCGLVFKHKIVFNKTHSVTPSLNIEISSYPFIAFLASFPPATSIVKLKSS